MMRLSQAAQVLNGKLIGQDAEFAAVSSDSRAITPGDLFVALQGEKFDGSAFVDGAAQSGAVAALVNGASYRKEKKHSIPLLLVEDTRLALGNLAAHWRTQFSIPVVAVTGSNGKTTVKEMLASVLRQHAENDFHDRSLSPRGITGDSDSASCCPSRMAASSIRVGVGEHPPESAVLATEGNLNNDIGMPLTLLKLRAAHRYAVIEMGMNHTGEIDYLTHLCKPDVAIINNASGAHLAGLGSLEAVAHAKGEIFAGLPLKGMAVINADDEFAPLWRELAGKHAITEFGLERAVAVHAQWRVRGYGAYIEVDTPQGSFKASLQVPGAHNVRNALAATAAAVALSVPLSAIVAGLEKFSGVAGRLQRKPALHGAVLIDDTYNANPASLRSAITVLMQSTGKKILVLGDMGELGGDAARMHAEIGAEIHRMGVDALFALGELSAHAVREFGAGARHFERIEDLLDALDKNLNTDSTVLVKGSRFMRMERVVRHCTQGEETCCSH